MSGYKTYGVCAIALIYAVSAFLTGNLELQPAFEMILAALGAAGLRHGIAKS